MSQNSRHLVLIEDRNKAATKIHVCTEQGHEVRLPGEILELNLNCQELFHCSLNVPFLLYPVLVS